MSTAEPTTDTIETDSIESASPRSRHRRITTAVVVVAAILGGLFVGASPAGAATAGWRLYDADSNGWNDSAVWYDSSNRVQYLYQDTNRDGYYDLWVSFDGYSRPILAWFDTNYNRTWDTVMVHSNGAVHSVLSNTTSEFDSNWDSLYYVGTGQRWSDQNNSGYIHHVDPIYGLRWGSVSSLLTGVIGSPSFTGNISMRLTETFGTAAAMHCYNYSWTDYCKRRAQW